MDEDLGLWPDAYPGFYPPMYNSGGDVEYPPLIMDPAEVVGLLHPTPADFLHAAQFSGTSYASNTIYIPPNHTSTSQRQQTNAQLHINTQLRPYGIQDSESPTTSNSSFLAALHTPCSHLHPEPRLSVYDYSPQSGPADGRTLMPEPEKPSPFPASPLSPYPPNFEGGMLDGGLPPPLIDIDAVTQVQMPHIIEWKKTIERCGASGFIPQTVYQPYTEADRQRYIRDVVLRETIFFQLEDSTELGISLEDVLKQKIRRLKDKDDRMFVGCGPSVSIRIQWPGYAPWSKQIPTMDFKTPKGNITRAKLAKNIATCIRGFVDKVQDKPMEAESDIRWKIGKRYIKVDDLILVSLHHVSKGSWQPQLRLRPSIPATPTYPWDESFSLIPNP